MMKLHLELLRGKCKRIYMTNIKPSILTAKWTEGFNFFLASDNRELKPLTGYIIKLSNAWTLHTNLFRKLQPWEQLNYSRLISVISILVFIGPIDAYFPILLRIDVELSSGYLAVIGDFDTNQESFWRRLGMGKKRKVIEPLPLDWWIIFIINQVQLEVLRISGKELPDVQHSCAGRAASQPVSLGVSRRGIESVNPAKM